MVKKAAALLFILSLGVIFSSSTFAQRNQPLGRSDATSSARNNSALIRVATLEGRLKACQARTEAIKTRLNNLIRLTENMVNVFDKIAQRVEEYYINKVVPSGKSLSEYDSLVADIAAKKALVQNSLDKAKGDASGFNCTTGKPKEQLTTFNQDMRSVKKDLKNYRTAIRNLIVAVHSLNGNRPNEATGGGSTE
jgi:hypothetical protein